MGDGDAHGVARFRLDRVVVVGDLEAERWLPTEVEAAAAAVMSLIQSAKLNDHDPCRYLKDVLERLPTQPNSRIEELLPHRWTPIGAGN